MKFTKKMQDIQDHLSMPLEDFLISSVTEHGLTWTADELGVSKATLGYWLLKFEIRTERVALRTSETITINPATREGT